MTTKKCFKCKQIKPLKMFYKHKQMADGHLNKCKHCAKKDVKERYQSEEGINKIVEYEKKRFKDPKRKAKVKIYQQKRRAKSKGKNRARHKVSNAIRNGRLKKLPCEFCGDINSQAHHDDYRKYLDVKWLCFKCHRKLHKQKTY